MKALDFLVWVRDEVHCIPQSKENECIGLPSKGELRRWLAKAVVRCNGKLLTKTDEVQWPITELVFFPKNDKTRVTIL